jgi:multiple antibiotic resistance protein
MQEHLQAIVTVLSLVNPAICAAMFSKIQAGRPLKAKFADATSASLAILVILILAAVFGAQILHQFGVSLDAFKVAGGAVLAWMGFGMLTGSSAETSGKDAESPDPSLTSLILFAASPGTITGVITIAVDHSKFGFPVTALVAVASAVAITWVVMVIVAGMRRKEGDSFMRDTVTRFMGLIVVAMGVQFVLTGLQSFFDISGRV